MNSDSTSGWSRNAARKAYDRFIRIKGEPREIALGFALGVVIGFTPALGLHLLIAVFLAALFRWNKIAAATGVWITNPFTAPFIYGFSYFIGAEILGLEGTMKVGSIKDFFLLYKSGYEIILALTIGGITLGLPAAVIGYYLAYGAVYEYQTKVKKKLAEEREKISQKLRRRSDKKSKTKQKRKQR